MIFRDGGLPGVRVIELSPQRDERGSFARTWCRAAFAEAGIAVDFLQSNTSVNHRKATLRGLHFQAPPHGEPKLVRCSRGRIFDVVLDVRPDSPAFGRWAAFELDARDGTQVFIPDGCAHGFQTLEDDCEVFYQMGAPHVPAAARGVHWADPALAIPWPLPAPIVSARDDALPRLVDLAIADTPRLNAESPGAEILEFRS